MATSIDPTNRFERVCKEYIAALKPTSGKELFIEKILQSHGATIEHTQLSVTTMMQGCSKSEFRMWMDKYVMPVVHILDKFSRSIDQMIAAYPTPSALVWGGLRCVIECLMSYSAGFEKAKAVLESLEGHIRSLELCDTMYALSTPFGPIIHHVVGLSYTHIIDLFYEMTKIFGGGSMKQLRRAGRPYNKLESALRSIETDAKELHKICTFANGHLQHGLRQEVTKVVENLEQDIAERARVAKERELSDRQNLEFQQERHLRELINSIIDDDNHNAYLLDDIEEKRFKDSCEWIFQTPQWHTWVAENSSSPILWLNREYGCGKSYICASSIYRIEAIKSSFPVFLPLSSDRQVPRRQLLRSLARQVLFRVQEQCGEIGKSTEALIHKCNSRTGTCYKELLSSALGEVRHVTIFLDGLEEFDDTGSMKSLIDYLMNEALRSSGRVRLWLSSQDVDWISNAVSAIPTSSVLKLRVTSDKTESDIARFLAHSLGLSTKIANAWDRFLVKVKMNVEVQGSFLWAVTMVEELKLLKPETSEEMVDFVLRGLPSTMHGFYRNKVMSYRQKKMIYEALPLWK